MTEIWKNVVGWEDYYQVSNIGRVWSKKRLVNTCDKNGENYTKRFIGGCIIKGSSDHLGYRRADLRDKTKGIRKNTLIHRIVAEAFIPNQYGKPHINHKDGVKPNNVIGNLEWCTHAENMRHAFANGFMAPFNGTEKGEKCPSAKLKDTQVVEIKKRLKRNEKISSISGDYPVSQSAISEIKAGRSWGHIIL